MPLGEVEMDSVFPKFSCNVETRCRIAQIRFQNVLTILSLSRQCAKKREIDGTMIPVSPKVRKKWEIWVKFGLVLVVSLSPH